MGYDLEQLNAYEKRCEICEEDHLTVECKDYFAMDKEKRMQLVLDKGLCRNCLATKSHKARDCNVKPSCGLMDRSRCSGKHHVSLHSENQDSESTEDHEQTDVSSDEQGDDEEGDPSK
jgi:ribosomal protein L40E